MVVSRGEKKSVVGTGMNHSEEQAKENGVRARITRRHLVKLGGLSGIFAAIYPSLTHAAMLPGTDQKSPEIGPIMQQLSMYMSAASERALPEDVVEKAKQHILDTFAAMISGSELPPGRGALDFARSYGGPNIATVVASKIVCGPIEAAFANGVLAHSDETDDSHGPSRSHPGASPIPAGFAPGEQ